MKTSRFASIALLSLGLGAWAPLGHAQNQPADKPAVQAEKADNATAKTVPPKQLAKQLNLTAEQKKKLTQLQADQRNKLQALRQEFEKNVEAMLTPEQLAKFKELNAQGGGTGKAGQAAQPTPRKPKNKAASAGAI